MGFSIGVASKEPVMRGVQGGVAQLCHQKQAPLKQMSSQSIAVSSWPKSMYPWMEIEL